MSNKLITQEQFSKFILDLFQVDNIKMLDGSIIRKGEVVYYNNCYYRCLNDNVDIIPTLKNYYKNDLSSFFSEVEITKYVGTSRVKYKEDRSRTSDITYGYLYKEYLLFPIEFKEWDYIIIKNLKHIKIKDGNWLEHDKTEKIIEKIKIYNQELPNLNPSYSNWLSTDTLVHNFFGETFKNVNIFPMEKNGIDIIYIKTLKSNYIAIEWFDYYLKESHGKRPDIRYDNDTKIILSYNLNLNHITK